jgi:cysteine synthase A
MSHFVFVESNTTGTGRIAVSRLLSRGDEVTFLTRARAKYPFLASPQAGLRVLDVETNDVTAVVEEIRNLQWSSRVDALMTFSEFYVSIVAEAAKALGYPCLDPAAAGTCRNKYLTQAALRSAGLPTCDFFLVSTEFEARRAADRITYPCVVKPPSDSSSHGVRLVANADELLTHYRELSSWKENIRGQHLTGEVLIETLVRGPEFSVETFTVRGAPAVVIGVTDKHLSEPPHFVEVGHDFPSGADPAIQRELIEAVSKALVAVHFDFGPAHSEIRWSDNRAVVIEINPRLAGGMIPELVQYSTGIDLLAAWTDLALGRQPQLTATRKEFASIRFVTAQQRGQAVGVGGAERARLFATVREVKVECTPGKQVRPAADAYDRLGHVIAAGGDRRGVLRDVVQAVEAIDIEIETNEAVAATAG